MNRLKRFFEPKYTKISVYVVLTGLALMILYHLVGSANIWGSGFFYALGWTANALLPLFYGFVIAYLLEPAVSLSERQLAKIPFLKKRLKSFRGISVLLVLLILLLGLSVLLSVMISSVTHEVKLADLSTIDDFASSVSSTADSFYKTLLAKMSDLNISSAGLQNYVKDLGQSAVTFVQGLGSGFGGMVGNISGFASSAMFSLIFGIYFMLDGKSLMVYWDRVFAALSNAWFYGAVHQLLKDADKAFSGYIRGQMIDALIVGVLNSIALSLVGVKFAIIIGILSGIGNLIPYVGPVVAYASTVLVCLLNWDLKRLLVALVVIFILQTLDGQVINPKLLSSNIEVHPMLVIAALIVGGAVGGILGMLTAVPIGALLKIEFEKFVDFREGEKGKEKEKHDSFQETDD